MLLNRNCHVQGAETSLPNAKPTWWEPRAASALGWRRQYSLSILHSCMNRVSPKTNCRALPTSLPAALGGSWSIVSFGGA